IAINLSKHPQVFQKEDGEYYTYEEEVFVRYLNQLETAHKSNFHMLEDYNIWKRDEDEAKD
ncbi:MAG: hypothetical protein AAF518_24265, partial [Spirochaetota bacterium]